MEINRVVVVGCGGVGGIVAARLHAAGHDVSAVTHNPEIADAIERHGLVASYDDGIYTAKFPAYTKLEPQGNMIGFDLCVLATPPDAAVEAVEDILPFLSEKAPVLCLPNGLVEARLSEIFGPQRFIGGIVEFGARRPAPGKVVQTAPGGVTIGRLPTYGRTADEGLRAVARLMEDAGPVHFAQNLEGARWSKLAINCAISSLGTIGGDRLGVLMRHRFVRRLGLEIWSEVVAVAHAEGVTLEKVAGTLDLEWLALSPEERLKSASGSLVAKHTLLLAVGTKFRNMRSSMLAAIERGRTPAVDFLNGEVVDRGLKHGIETPINRAMQQTVHAISRGEMKSSVQTLRALFDRTRDELRQLDMVG